MPIRLVLADDHAMFLDGLAAVFHAESGLEVVASCRDGDEALRAVREHDPDVLVLDLRMPRVGGIEVIRALRSEGRRARVVVLTAALDEGEVVEAVRLGVRGVVLKEMASEMLIKCVRRVHEGGTWIERTSAGRALEQMVQRGPGRGEATTELTHRELDVVRLVLAGMRNKEIAERLAIGEGTVKIHLHHVYEKLSVDSRLELAAVARARGLS
jgi:two-component system nitrate/nitrite response regulator NarL